MINNLNILLPEIFLTLSIFSILMIGVFIKNSFNLIFNLTSLIILLTIAIILNGSNNVEKIFLESFTRDAFSNFFNTDRAIDLRCVLHQFWKKKFYFVVKASDLIFWKMRWKTRLWKWRRSMLPFIWSRSHYLGLLLERKYRSSFTLP